MKAPVVPAADLEEREGIGGKSVPLVESTGDQVLDLVAEHRLLLQHSSGGDVVRLVRPDGSTSIAIVITEQGVTLKIDGASLALESTGDISISAERLTLHGRESVALTTDGDLALAATGDVETRGRAQMIRAELGSVAVKANDDVKLNGERVMVNCDETIDRYFKR